MQPSFAVLASLCSSCTFCFGVCFVHSCEPVLNKEQWWSLPEPRIDAQTEQTAKITYGHCTSHILTAQKFAHFLCLPNKNIARILAARV
uniref:Putative secreted protein n=1 Tax=Ixodes ricinus TaxID=34613 RepID=A0A6B0U0A7_IXORI